MDFFSFGSDFDVLVQEFLEIKQFSYLIFFRRLFYAEILTYVWILLMNRSLFIVTEYRI